MSKTNTNPITFGQMSRATARSHELQSAGVDYQAAAATACEENNIPIGTEALNSDEYNELTSSNGPGCYCSFCKTAFPFDPETDIDPEPYY